MFRIIPKYFICLDTIIRVLGKLNRGIYFFLYNINGIVTDFFAFIFVFYLDDYIEVNFIEIILLGIRGHNLM